MTDEQKPPLTFEQHVTAQLEKLDGFTLGLTGAFLELAALLTANEAVEKGALIDKLRKMAPTLENPAARFWLETTAQNLEEGMK